MSHAIDQLYQTILLEEAQARTGEDDPTGSAGHSHQVNPTCGDELTVGVDVEDGKVSRVVWVGDGCTISIASASMLSELAPGWTVEEGLEAVKKFREVMHSRGKLTLDEDEFGDAIALSGVSKYIMRVKCAMLAWMAFEDALAQAQHAGSGQAKVGARHC